MEYRTTYHNAHGVRRTAITDSENPDTLRVYTEVDMDEVIEGIKRDRELHPSKSTNKLLARVPLTVYEKSIIEQWDDNDWKKWLNDPDNEVFRVWRGRV